MTESQLPRLTLANGQMLPWIVEEGYADTMREVV